MENMIEKRCHTCKYGNFGPDGCSKLAELEDLELKNGKSPGVYGLEEDCPLWKQQK